MMTEEIHRTPQTG